MDKYSKAEGEAKLFFFALFLVFNCLDVSLIVALIDEMLRQTWSILPPFGHLRIFLPPPSPPSTMLRLGNYKVPN